ncbi:MAG: hypothetical protein AAF224_05335 [Pseudomonadota bacterium]
MTTSVLFVCNQNSVRSPMAAALLLAARGDAMRVDSAGVYEGIKDPFLDAILADAGAGPAPSDPKDLNGIDAAAFDVAVALTPEAETALADHFPAEKIEFWPTRNPTETRGSRDQIVEAYRDVCNDLKRLIDERFPAAPSAVTG